MKSNRSRQSRGFTLIELMIVVAIIGILAAIAIPNFIRFQARARQAEVLSNLKSLFTGLKTLNNRPSTAIIRIPGFAPERGNRYSYVLADPCTTFEDRSDLNVVVNPDDDCVGADAFKWDGFPNIFAVTPPTSAVWNSRARGHAMATAPGFFGSPQRWDFLAYATGDVDNAIVADIPDSWLVSSSDGTIVAACPLGPPFNIAAGEPTNVYNDVTCD